MASRGRTVLEAFLTVLRANHTHYDLSAVSGTERVVVAHPRDTHELAVEAYVRIGPPQIRSTHEADMTQYRKYYEHDWQAILAPSTTSESDGLLEVMDLASDVVEALEDARNTSGVNATLYDIHSLLVDVEVHLAAGDLQGVHFAQALGTITWFDHLEAGT